MDLKSKMVANYFISSDSFFDDYLSRSLDFSMPPSEKGNHYLELQINIWYMHLILTRMYHGPVMEDAHLGAKPDEYQGRFCKTAGKSSPSLFLKKSAAILQVVFLFCFVSWGDRDRSRGGTQFGPSKLQIDVPYGSQVTCTSHHLEVGPPVPVCLSSPHS